MISDTHIQRFFVQSVSSPLSLYSLVALSRDQLQEWFGLVKPSFLLVHGLLRLEFEKDRPALKMADL